MHFLKKLCLLILIVVSALAKGQFITINATNASTVVSNNLYNPDFLKAYGVEGYYSKGISFIPYNFNYNIGVDATLQDTIINAYVVTGISYIIATPTGFSATNPENVTYVTSNWLNYATLNIYNGIQLNDTAYHYQFAGEIGYNIGYVMGKHLFLHFGAAARYNMIPDLRDSAAEFNSYDLVLKAGLLWKFSRKYNKP